MPFQITAAYSVVMVTIFALGGLAVYNRRSGWRPKRLSLLDVLLARAVAQAKAHQSWEKVIPETVVGPMSTTCPLPTMQYQLSALNFALNAHGPVTPSPKASIVELQEIANTESTVRT